jgi:superfamily I DNA/RNA helicase
MPTFDNSAAGALREKIAQQLEQLRIPHNEFVISTLNAFGFRILRDHFPSERKEIIESARPGSGSLTPASLVSRIC